MSTSAPGILGTLGILDYDALVQTYRESLVTRLRGFRAGDETMSFLESWVCHEDDVRSVEDLLDAAVDHGVSAIALRFGSATLSRVAWTALEAAMRAFGSVEAVRRVDGAMEVAVTLHAQNALRPTMGEPAVGPQAKTRRAVGGSAAEDHAAGTSPIYDAALARITTFAHESAVRSDANDANDAICASLGSGEIAVRVDAGVVRSASHHGASGWARALLEVTCATIEGLPLREVFDHGALRVELRLRGREGTRPVAGVTTVASADARLRECERCLRELVTRWEARGDGLPLPTTNEFVRAPQASWLAASAKERLARIDAVLVDILPSLGLAADALRCLDIENDVRVIVTGARLASGGVLFDIERALKDRVEPELCVYLDEMVDANVIRRLTKREPS